MKNIKKISLVTVLVLCLSILFSVNAFAAAEGESIAAEGGKLDMNYIPDTVGERVELALQGSATGMIMVFAVLGLLCIILYISKYFLYDLPRKESPEEKAARAERERKAKEAREAKEAEKAKRAAERAAKQTVPVTAAPVQNDGELVAVITAAIAAMIESGDYKNEFVGGFRVVSFKRSDKRAWNRK